MFENIVGFFKKLFKKETEEENNKDMAKERLHLVLMQDRANVSADFLDMMKQEIIDVIKKYIDVDESEIDVHLTNKTSDDGTTGPALYANIPIVSIKHSGDIDDETKEKVKEQKIEKDEKEVVESQEKTEKEDNEEKVEEVVESQDKKEDNKEKIEEKVENKDEKENKEVAKKVNKSNNKKEKNNKDKEKSADDTITEKKDAIIADDKENEEKVELKVEEMDVTDEGEVLNQKEEKTEKKQKKKVEKKEEEEEVKKDNKKTSNKKRK